MPAGSSTSTSSCTSRRCPWPVGSATCGARGGSSSARSSASRSARSWPAWPRRWTSSSSRGRSRRSAAGRSSRSPRPPRPTSSTGHDRPRALGVIGALTFLGMAAGPFLGAAILDAVRPEAALVRLGLLGTPAADFLAPAWRYVFYVNVPIGIVALAFGWAATAGWDTPRSRARVDVLGALLFSVALGGDPPRRHDPRRAGRRRRRSWAGPRDRLVGPGGRRGRRGHRRRRHRAAPARSVPRSAPVRRPRLLVGGAREPAHRLRVRHRHRRDGRLRGPRPLRWPRRPADRARRPGRGDRRRAHCCRDGSSGTGRCAS